MGITKDECVQAIEELKNRTASLRAINRLDEVLKLVNQIECDNCAAREKAFDKYCEVLRNLGGKK